MAIDALGEVGASVARHVGATILGAVSLLVTGVGITTALALLFWQVLRRLFPDLWPSFEALIADIPYLHSLGAVGFICLALCVAWLCWLSGVELFETLGRRASDHADRGWIAFLGRQIGRLTLGAASVAISALAVLGLLVAVLGAIAWVLLPPETIQAAAALVSARHLWPLATFAVLAFGICIVWLCWSIGYAIAHGE
ncbi:hypothetical protein E4T66_17650 [Sinimarinibacterium sp. CAU 1509]|uniref:hypothetical protein n=1 Tax=Sinimarinibacterium sp. CAU 1509 TaxID=2562283 RepID=UPI0010ACBC00|nr:hypothetical protein [Sinimarinibacterium sp. CAU 1509]TJY57233.1 hypothetical protein E4T66_17650 [Sinimarinibacterium sp. CAU 1509]